jgi:hypothetical protein
MKKSEILAIRIDSDLLDYVRDSAIKESRSISKQVIHILARHKSRADLLKIHGVKLTFDKGNKGN